MSAQAAIGTSKKSITWEWPEFRFPPVNLWSAWALPKETKGDSMNEYVLRRTYGTGTWATTGTLTCPSGKQMTTIERPWLDNQVNISCIPEGSYIVERDKHGRHTWFKVNDVENRSAIEIHEGYKVSHSAGCILLDLIELQDLLLETKGESFVLKITS